MRTRNQKTGQSVLEYVLMIAAVTAVMITMSTMLRRSAQGMVRMVADQIGVQQNAEQINPDEGYLARMDVSMDRRDTRGVQERLGNVFYTQREITETNTFVITDMGER